MTAMSGSENPLPDRDSSLGGRLELFDPDSLTPQQQDLWARMDETMAAWARQIGFTTKNSQGRFIGPFNPMLLSPEIAQSFLQLQVDEAGHSGLSERVREVVILSVGAVWTSPYELYAHGIAAGAAGFSDRCVAALKNGLPCEELSEQEALAQRLALALTKAHAIDDTLYADGWRTFGGKGLADLAVLAGCYHLVCGVLNLFAIPAPETQLESKKDCKKD